MKSTFVFLVTLLAGLGVLTPAAPRAAGTPSPSYHWVSVTPSAPITPRDGAGARVYRDAMWRLGGWNPGDKVHFPKICSNDVWRSTDGATWTLVKPNTFGTDEFDPETDWEGRHTAG